MKVHETIVHRKTEAEALQAIEDLKKRGFEIVSPLINKFDEKKQYSQRSNGTYRYDTRTLYSQWVCKLRRVVE